MQILELFDDVPLREREQEFRLTQTASGLRKRLASGLCMAQPGTHIREWFQRFWIQYSFHYAAVRVPAYYDVRHAQDSHGVFNRRGNAANRFGIARHNVADHTAEKQLARFGLCQKARINS